MTDSFLGWLFEQGPLVVIMVIGWWLLWRQNTAQRLYLERLLDECWAKVLDCMDDGALPARGDITDLRKRS